MKYSFDCQEMTHNGGRPVNEDSIGHYIGEKVFGFILCDGLGGHGMGDVASGIVRDVFVDQYSKLEKPGKELGRIFESAQDILTSEQNKHNASSKMKTTVATVVCDTKKAYIGHIGDSRVYTFDNKGKWHRTIDHSVPQMLALAHDIKDEDIRNHPDRSSLLKAMGNSWDGKPYELDKAIPLRKCKAFLLCSDGFWELITENEMMEALNSSANAAEWLSKMDALVKSRGAEIGEKMDNNSAIAIIVNKG